MTTDAETRGSFLWILSLYRAAIFLNFLFTSLGKSPLLTLVFMLFLKHDCSPTCLFFSSLYFYFNTCLSVTFFFVNADWNPKTCVTFWSDDLDTNSYLWYKISFFFFTFDFYLCLIIYFHPGLCTGFILTSWGFRTHCNTPPTPETYVADAFN